MTQQVKDELQGQLHFENVVIEETLPPEFVNVNYSEDGGIDLEVYKFECYFVD